MGKLNEIQEQTTQSYGDNSFTTTIKENTVEFDSAKDSFTFNDPIEVPELRINGTEIVAFDAEDRAKLDSLQTPMQIKGRVDGVGDLPTEDVKVGDVYLVGLSGDGNFEEYVCAEVSGSPVTPVWENLGHVKTQSDWNQSNISADNYIKNKPAINAGQGENSIIEGNIGNNVAGGVYAHAEGNNSAANGLVSHAEGSGTTAIGDYSHAEGKETTASGQQSHTEGRTTTASGYCSHAEGKETTASGYNSHTEGGGTIANHKSQHVFGEFNIADHSLINASARGNYIEIVGNGSNDTTRSNARTLDWSGNETLAGNLTIGGTITVNGQEITPTEPQVQADWNQNDSESVDYIKNKPTITSTQTQADWNQTTSEESDYIKNKPTKLSDFINDGEGDSPLNPFTTIEDVTNRISAHNSDITTHEDIRLSVASQGERISAVEELIPAQATPSNNLADKEFVNSSISTNTANFKGTYNTLAELEATTADNNDYGFIITTDASGNTVYNRYKYNGTSWSYEYALNNSAFTTAQWDAINSNATTAIISDLLSHASNISNPHAVTKSQVGLGDVDNTSDLNKPLSTAAVAEFATKQDALGFTPENVTNKKTSLVDNSDTYYPTQKAVKTAVDAKVTGAASSTDNELAVYNATTGKVLKSGSGVSAGWGNLTATNDVASATKTIANKVRMAYDPATDTLKFNFL